MIWFTSDFHIGDIRMLKRRKLFLSLEEMEQTLINNYNQKVGCDDIVWLVGDIVGDIESALRVFPRLNGKKNYVIGNHDRKWIRESQVQSFFNNIYESTVEMIENVPVSISHYPLYEWYKSKYGGVLIHGHMHDEYIDLPFYKNFCAYDVSIEKNNYEPVSWYDIVEHFEKDKKKILRL